LLWHVFKLERLVSSFHDPLLFIVIHPFSRTLTNNAPSRLPNKPTNHYHNTSAPIVSLALFHFVTVNAQNVICATLPHGSYAAKGDKYRVIPEMVVRVNGMEGTVEVVEDKQLRKESSDSWGLWTE
jgi:hypothetical protein